SVSGQEVVVEALWGTGFHGEVRDPIAQLIDMINAKRTRGIVAIDVPSGLDCDSGQPSNATIRADLTVTFVADKKGFAGESAGQYVGRVEVADIGAPPELIAEAAAFTG
ncbi:MAG: NAD(P)H-hydrate epimerase, partial [Planctomycetes bacterium]|nr:NAD(P)H-hydrate epimerase [Planctomycetota bacterium]